MTSSPSLYLHVPFCLSKCDYCAFYSVPYVASLADAYLSALEFELHQRWPPGCSPATVYMGGGTPTMLSSGQLERLCAMVVSLAPPGRETEWSVEANPATLDERKLAVLVCAGVNRVSIGAQSFDASGLCQLGRAHRVEDIADAVQRVRSAGLDNIGIDLIAAVPGISPAAWRESLRSAAGLGPAHVSVYTLGLEPGTPMAMRVKQGEIPPPSETEQLAAMRLAEQELAAAGFARYEVSNFARPGRECRHNLGCWRGEDYVGVGVAASSRLGRARRTNEADLEGYVAATLRREDVPHELERLDERTDAGERIAFGFRLAEGVRVADYASPGSARFTRWDAAARALETAGLLHRVSGDQWQPTARGWEFADTIAAKFLVTA